MTFNTKLRKVDVQVMHRATSVRALVSSWQFLKIASNASLHEVQPCMHSDAATFSKSMTKNMCDDPVCYLIWFSLVIQDWSSNVHLAWLFSRLLQLLPWWLAETAWGNAKAGEVLVGIAVSPKKACLLTSFNHVHPIHGIYGCFQK